MSLKFKIFMGIWVVYTACRFLASVVILAAIAYWLYCFAVFVFCR